MGNSRTSNRDVLEAVNELTGTVATLVAAMAANQGTAVPSAPTIVEAKSDEITLPKDYLAKMEPRFQAFANKIGETVVSFAYLKSNGRKGLWSVPKSKLPEEAKRRGDNYLGAVAEYQPK